MTMESTPLLGWRSRGYLPHFHAPRAIQSITYRMSDSLPPEVVSRMLAEIDSEPEAERQSTLRRQTESFLDGSHGSCLLRMAETAKVVEDAWLHFDAVRYHLLAWVVMPNHVHVLIELNGSCSLDRIIQSWKSYTARRIRQWCLGAGLVAPDPFWQREYWDRWVRDEEHFRLARSYIERNPVTAGLVVRPERWRWSSAWEARTR